MSFDKLIELTESEPKRIREWERMQRTIPPTKQAPVRIARLLRLCGGGEQAINNGTTGWGSPPSGTTNTTGTYLSDTLLFYLHFRFGPFG